ncbi:hypothetical protein Lnau_0871 [Legionella nautarum]|uniref:Thioredoxin domain-containing protein n=1 Tax=Legionella nautarum TaxID=45070 RepID=A0A0W0WUB8_9GAMM|nr:hypothetical protein [Legionella nautarum]KTD35887.1 hypothetical protein Lnau_0871 [Legionella nautarum]
MQVMLKNTLAVFLLLFSTLGWSQDLSSWFSKGENNQIKLRVDLFLSSTCPHCQKADAFFHSIEAQTPWLDIHRYIINKDKTALDTFHQDLQQLDIDDYAVPAIFFCNSRWIGFDETGITGQNLLKGLNYCHQQISQQGTLEPETVSLLEQLSNASWFNANMTSKPSLALFTLTMALTDAFSPCSLFVFFALFSFLWLHKEPKEMIGFTVLFLLALMIVHHFQQDHTIFFYQILNSLRIFALLIGLGLIVYMLIIYSRGSSAHPNFSIPILVFLTAAITQAYQQNCIPNFGLVYQQWLDSQRLPTLQGEIVEIIYHFIYVIPLAIFAALFIYFREHQKLQKIAPLLTHTAWFLLLILGVFLVVLPEGLSSFGLSLGALGLSLLTGWLTIRKSSRLNR